VLASSADLVDDTAGLRVVGDPVEGALLLAGRERGLTRDLLLDAREHVHEIPFEPEHRQMTVVYREPSGLRAYVKGAPEVLLGRAAIAPAERMRLETTAGLWAAEGLRVIAFAECGLSDDSDLDGASDAELQMLGLVALHDPLRASAPAAIAAAGAAGIDVRMLTGDHEGTARAVGRALGLPQQAIFARVTPAGKLRLVEELQAGGHVVAVTGDGVNDAPALRRADVGIAMGLSGTETAREAADIVLTDDEFATIVAALREGRRIADNVRKFVAFLLSANLGEVVLFAAAILSGLGAPMTVAQVLFVNVLTDGLPALALARDPALPETMASGPRRDRSLFPPPLAAALAGVGLLVGVSALAAYLVGRSLDGGSAQTMAFATVALAELALVFTCRSVLTPAWRVPRNPHLVLGVVLSAALVVLALYVPALHEPFGTEALSARELLVVTGLALLPFLLVETGKALLARRSHRDERP
jgi:Ca2+-transporting ATPase